MQFRTSQYSVWEQAFRYQNDKEYFSWEGGNLEPVLKNTMHILTAKLTRLKQRDKILVLISSIGESFAEKSQQSRPKNFTIVYFSKAYLGSVWSAIAVNSHHTISASLVWRESGSWEAGIIPECSPVQAKQLGIVLVSVPISSSYCWFYYWRVWLSFGVGAQA